MRDSQGSSAAKPGIANQPEPQSQRQSGIISQLALAYGTPVDLKTITITWMDGVSETYRNVATSVRDGVLHVHRYTSVTNQLTGEWHFPISNIRVWGPANGNGHAYAKDS